MDLVQSFRLKESFVDVLLIVRVLFAIKPVFTDTAVEIIEIHIDVVTADVIISFRKGIVNVPFLSPQDSVEVVRVGSRKLEDVLECSSFMWNVKTHLLIVLQVLDRGL